MFKFRREQKVAFAEVAVEQFEERMLAHLRAFFPDRLAALGAGEIRGRIRDGIRRAAAYGIASEPGVCAYIDVMFVRGDQFDNEPWAAAILNDASIESSFERAEQLLAAATQGHAVGAPPVLPKGLVSARPVPLASSRTRRAIVEVRLGRSAGTRAVLTPGQTLRAGGSNVVDLPIPHDRSLSGEHFSLTWDGAHCTLRDLGSAGGTLLLGQRVKEAEVPSGASIRAGDTVFVVYHEAHTPPRAGAPAGIDETLLALHTLSRTPHLHAVIDASRGARPLQLLREAVDESRSLYDGAKGQSLDYIAPYLVRFQPDSGLLERLVREGWGGGWGIFLTCQRPFKDVRRHLRRFLLIEDDETGQRFFFRFYDPRVLRVFLPTCTPRQHQDLFGEIDAFLVEGPHGELCRLPRVGDPPSTGAHP